MLHRTWLIPSPDDADVIVPLMMRLTNSTELPVLLVGGKTVGLEAFQENSAISTSNSAKHVFARIQAMQRAGSLEKLIENSGALVNGWSKANLK